MIKDIILDLVGYHVGVTFLRIVTFGSYPPEPVDQRHRLPIEFVGILLIFLFITVLWLLLV